MEIKSGDAFERTNGETVRVSRVFDVYESYSTAERVGHDPTTHVRFSPFWHDDGIMFPRDETLSEFLDNVERKLDADDVAETNRPSPGTRRS